MTEAQIRADLAPSQFVAGANLSLLVSRLRRLGIPKAEAEEIVTKAFQIGCDASSEIWRRCVDQDNPG